MDNASNHRFRVLFIQLSDGNITSKNNSVNQLQNVFIHFQRRCQAPSQVAKRFSSPAATQPASKIRRKSDVKYKEDDDDDSDEDVIRSPFNNLGNLSKTTLSFEPSASSHHVRLAIHVMHKIAKFMT